MANINAKTFPGVYTQVIDRSFILPQTSRFRAGLVGVARKGPFDTPTAVTSLSDFIRQFGQPITGDFFLANAVAMLSDLTDGMKIVRVGKGSTDLTGATAITTEFSNTGTILPYSKAAVLLPGVQNYGGNASPAVYVTIKQNSKVSTVNAQVANVGTLAGGYLGQDAGTVTFTEATAIQDLYTAGEVAYSVGAPAANEAESILYAYTYGSIAGDYADAPIYSGAYQLTASGNKGAYQFTLSPASAWASLAAGDLLKIKQSGKATTHEVRVKQSLPDGTVYLETTDRQDIGFQALPLQDQYTAATIHRMTGRMPFLWLNAASAGDWANGDDITSGLFVKVRPGGPQGTKKFEIYEAGALTETLDGLYQGAGSNSYTGRINGISQQITVYGPTGTVLDMQPANYSLGYANGAYLINAGQGDSGGNFYFGANGEGATATDFIGEFDPVADRFTGMQSFIDTDNMQIDVLCCPGITDAQEGGSDDTYPWDTTVLQPFADSDTTGVHLKMVEVCRRVKAVALIDVPPGLTARQAIDWHNGQGLYSGRGRIDSANGACYWNWFTITDPFTAQTKWVPPTLGALRCLAFTFDRDKPWYAAAGETRGLIPEAKTVEFEHVSDETKQAMYGVGTGQSVNGIFLDNGQIKLWGERTLQVAESKLSVVHNVILVNYVVNNLASIGRRFVFEPNDAELLMRIRLAYTQFLDQIKTERGIEEYNLVIDDSNNNADTRNRREVVVNLALVPVDSVERIFIYCTVNSSGADLKNATAE